MVRYLFGNVSWLPSWHGSSMIRRSRHRILYVFVSNGKRAYHYSDIIMGAMASQITSLTVVFPTVITSITIVYSIVNSGADQRKHQSSASLAFVRGLHRGPVNSPHKGPVTRKMFPFDDVIIIALDDHRCGNGHPPVGTYPHVLVIPPFLSYYTWGRNFKSIIFKLISSLGIGIGWVNGSVPSNNKPLSRQILTQI